MDTLTQSDKLRYEAIKKEAATDELTFREHARQHASDYPRAIRQLVTKADTKETPIYTLFTLWTEQLAPELESLIAKSKAPTLRNALAKQLHLTESAAEIRANELLEERTEALRDSFVVTNQYCATKRSQEAAYILFSKPIDEVMDIRDRYTAYMLHQAVAREYNLAVYDAHAPGFRRFRLGKKEKRQVKRYKKAQGKRFDDITAKQQALKAYRGGIIGRIITLNLDTILVLDAYRQYKKRLDALTPASKTPAKTLSLFTAATKPIRESYASMLTTTSKLADMQESLKEIDSVLVEIFDMSDSERNALMINLKEYRELDREAVRITKEQAAHQ